MRESSTAPPSPDVPPAVADVLDATGLVYSTDRAPGYRRLGKPSAFRYVDEDVRSISASDVNAYLKLAAGAAYSAKDFRTWGATVVAANAMLGTPAPESERQSARSINAAIGQAAGMLGNTLAVCRKSYVHPGVLNPALAGAMARRRHARHDRLSIRESRTLALLDAAAQPLAVQLSQSLRRAKR